MLSDWKGPFKRRLQRERSERGRRMARRRWDLDREERNRLAKVTAEQYPNRIVRRVIVIDDERDAREAVIFQWDSAREAKRKLRQVLGRSSPHNMSSKTV
jgi:hypothetical protein